MTLGELYFAIQRVIHERVELVNAPLKVEVTEGVLSKHTFIRMGAYFIRLQTEEIPHKLRRPKRSKKRKR